MSQNLVTFHQFPNLPLEIRHLIWFFSAHPRVVTLYKHYEDISPLQTNHTTHHRGIFSTSPIPASLHTCRESRKALKDFGYELTFGTGNSAPLTWFNYRVDVLYLMKSNPRRPKTVVWVASGDGNGLLWEWDTATDRRWIRSTEPPEFDLKGLKMDDIIRIKRLALFNLYIISIQTNPTFFDDTANDGSEISSELYKIVQRFNSLVELLIVEQHVGTIPLEKEVRDSRKEPWGYVECEDIDIKAGVWRPGARLSRLYHRHIRKHAEQNMGEWSGYFREREKKLESWLVKMNELALSVPSPPSSPAFQPPPALQPPPPSFLYPLILRRFPPPSLPFYPELAISHIPKIRIVAVMTRLEGNKLLVARDEYRLTRARSRFVKKIPEEFEEGFEDEYDVIREWEEDEKDENWALI